MSGAKIFVQMLGFSSSGPTVILGLKGASGHDPAMGRCCPNGRTRRRRTPPLPSRSPGVDSQRPLATMGDRTPRCKFGGCLPVEPPSSAIGGSDRLASGLRPSPETLPASVPPWHIGDAIRSRPDPPPAPYCFWHSRATRGHRSSGSRNREAGGFDTW